MKRNLKSFLKEIANKPELIGNRFAWTLASYYNESMDSREKLYESLSPYYPSKEKELSKFLIEPTETEKQVNQFEKKDFRIKSIRLAGLRGFPNSPKPFGIDFTKNSKPSNAVILGSNASGKSSIFNAIEYLYCREVGEAKLRTIGNPDYKDYLSHFTQDFNKVNCTISTLDGDFDIHSKALFPESVYKKINPNTHFISEYDIIDLGTYDYQGLNDRSFHILIAKSLGLEDYLNFSSLLNQFLNYNRIKEKKAVTFCETEISNSTKSIEVFNQEISNRREQLLTINNQTNTEISLNIEKYLNVIAKAKINDIAFKIDLSTLNVRIRTYATLFEELKSSNISISEQNENEFLSLGVQLLSDVQNCPFCQNSRDNIDSIKLNVQKRIERIKKYSEIYSKLSTIYIEVSEQLNEIKRYITVLSDNIYKEKAEFFIVPDLKNLIVENDKMILSYRTAMDDPFWNSSLTEKPKIKVFEDFMRLLRENRSYFSQVLPTIFTQSQEYIEKRAKLIKEAEININAKSNGKDLIEKKAILEKEIRDFLAQIEKAQNNIMTNQKELVNAKIFYQNYLDIKEDSRKFHSVVKSTIDKETNEAFETVSNTVISILKYYLKSVIEKDDVELVFEKDPETDIETGEITSETLAIRIKHKEKGTISPNKYFNAFRYKLFSMSVAISVAIASRSTTQVNLPFVWDDLFYASDFERRITIENFIKTIFNILEIYSKELPLQLIVFTHDELIFDSILNAITEIGKDDDTIFARLLPYNDTEVKSDYLELTYRMPERVPQNMLTELV